MRRLIKQRDIVVDEWRYADEDPVGRERALILPFARWKEERERWWLWDGRLGVRLGPTDPVDALAQDFLRVSLVAIEFGGLADGGCEVRQHVLTIVSGLHHAADCAGRP